MNKQDIHNRIEKILKKLQNLNQNISTDDIPDSVEIDLFNAYLKNLSEQSNLLESIASQDLSGSIETEDKVENLLTDNSFKKTEESTSDVSHEDSKTPEVNSAEKSKPESQLNTQRDNEEKNSDNIDEKKDNEIEIDSVLTGNISQKEKDVKEGFEDEKKDTEINESLDSDKKGSDLTENEIPEKQEVFLEKDKETDNIKKESDKNKGNTTHLLSGKDIPLSIHDKLTSGGSNQDKKKSGSGMKRFESLKDIFDLNDRFTYSKVLFNGNMDLFSQAIREIGTLNDSDIAVKFVEENYAVKFNWETNEALAEEFKEKITYYFDLKR
ncbi:MAG: hypothetical protein EA412_07855 [Chitinophagaceae bacterium]|nr:MAG: hypothetical protein EA412_07855 [Chitinophagaceae bacterium]